MAFAGYINAIGGYVSVNEGHSANCHVITNSQVITDDARIRTNLDIIPDPDGFDSLNRF